MTCKITIVGRPNVGKSTLFNRLAKRRLALVAPTPGLTRDWQSATIELQTGSLMITDTAGLETATSSRMLTARMSQHSETAIDQSDGIVFVIDGRTGITAIDRQLANWLRRKNIPLLLVVNKAESALIVAESLNCYELGLGDPIAISAEHGLGIPKLLDALEQLLHPTQPANSLPQQTSQTSLISAPEIVLDEQGFADPAAVVTDESNVPPLRLAIVGRPNVGKSTLVNSLLGETRQLVGSEAGITRDAITIDWRWRHHYLQLVDTAGLRRKSRVTDLAEQLAVNDAISTVRMSHVVVLLVNALQGMMDKQDLTIASLTLQEQRVLVIALNKWDQIRHAAATKTRFEAQLTTSLAQARGITLIPISALHKHGLQRLMNSVINNHQLWQQRVPTGRLNRCLQELTLRHPPVRVAGRPLKLQFLTQVKTRPPTFVLWLNQPPRALSESYRRYLLQNLRREFDFPGVPLRLILRQRK